ncbi:MAG TPA: lactonase family protein [Paenibacillus sp.]|jgi:6-phosphogluconolactonase
MTERLLLFVGSYAESTEPGIYMYELNLASGEMKCLDSTSGMKNPTFVSVDKHGKKLYAISETKNEKEERIGEAVSYSIDPQQGKLTELNRALTIQPSSSHIQLDHSCSYLAVSGYHGGNVGLVKIEADGTVGGLSDVQQHTGHGADPERQDRPHPHSVQFSPDNRFALVADLGLDRIKVYELDQEEDKLVYRSEAVMQPASGPRHMAFHPNGKWLYSINEVGSSLTAFTFDTENGSLTELETLSTLPADFQGENTTAEVAISEDGRFLYGSNRGHDSIVQFAIDPESGKLSLVDFVSSEGGHPRHFAITPDGEHLLAANRDSNNLVLFRIDRSSGKLKFTGHTAEVSKPVCVKPIRF